MYFRGREMAHIDIGRNILERLVKDLSGVGEVEAMPKLEGKLMSMSFKPK